jgi:Tol biopolymer transport system component
MVRSLTALLIMVFFVFGKCRKDGSNNECIIPDITPIQPYSYPVWHPNGQIVGFNYTPLSSITQSGTPPCIWYTYFGKADSTGFYIMNKNGTGLNRITNFELGAPSWSPDGNWIAFSIGPNIYKMRYTGSDFDTSNIIQLTNSGANFYPSWAANSDSIYYDSNIGTNGQGYYIWKMANDGTGKTGFPNTGRQPFVASNGKIYYVKGSSGQPEIFSMNKDGSSQQQETFTGQNGNRDNPNFYQGTLFYNDNGSIRKINNTGQDIMLISPAITFDISILGEVIYSKTDFDNTKYNKQIGTLWIVNTDGSNNRQITFNNL